MNNIAMYMRISVDENDENTEESINSQRNIIKSYIFSSEELKGAKLHEYIDEGYSGSTTSRPGLDKLLSAVKNRKIDCIIVKDMSRFMRDYIEMGNYLENIFPFLCVRFIAITDGYDSLTDGTNGTEITIQFKNLLNDYYCRDISIKMKSSLKVNYEKGRYVTGNPPYGYIKDPDNYQNIIIDDVVADNVRYMFSLILEGKTLSQIAKILNDEGILTSRARRKELLGYDSYKGRCDSTAEETIWCSSMVRRIVHNEVYTGTYVYNKSSKSKLDGGKVIYYPESEWKKIYNHHESIISKEDYDSARKMLKSRHRKHLSGNRVYESSPLVGMVRCNKCGYKVRIVATTDGNKVLYRNVYCQHCRLLEEEEKFARLDIFENKVFEILKSNFHTDEKERQKLLNKQKALYDENDKLDKKKLQKFEEYKFGKLKREEFIKIKDKLKIELENNLKEIEEIDTMLKKAGNIESLTKEMVMKYIKTIYISSSGIEKIDYI